MAYMIPEKPRRFDPASQEGLMFEALEHLPDDYYVIHSFHVSDVKKEVLHESETDFVVYHPQKGIICIEAKAGSIRYEDGDWKYSSGIVMKGDGPFNQAASNKWKLKRYIENGRMSFLLTRLKMLHAVWFPSIDADYLKNISFPPEAEKKLVLTKEALTNPQIYIEKIFEIKLPNGIETHIGEQENKRFLREVLCPRFNIFPTVGFDTELKNIVFHRMLKEQAAILDFLEEQRIAVINGAAGTGKTLLAIEKAVRHASNNEKVLFLCFNSRLKEHLSKIHRNENIDFYTIAGFACKVCGTKEPDYIRLRSRLDDFYLTESFPYRHIIVDEGQDFGIDNIEEANILQIMHDIIRDIEAINGTFYVFYDRLQLVQGKEIPAYIQDAECRLTLHRNCRNTENIARTSLKPISERKPKVFEGSIKGIPPSIHFCLSDSDVIERTDSVISSLEADGFAHPIILTCKTEDSGILSSEIKDGKYKGKYEYTSCRKFKGLESDAVIITDLDESIFETEKVLLYYVGTSRARLRLEIITTINDEGCLSVLANRLKPNAKVKVPKREFASALYAVGSVL